MSVLFLSLFLSLCDGSPDCTSCYSWDDDGTCVASVAEDMDDQDLLTEEDCTTW